MDPSATGEGQVADYRAHSTLKLTWIPYKVRNLAEKLLAYKRANLFHDGTNTSETMTTH
jgi:hypothetical protein